MLLLKLSLHCAAVTSAAGDAGKMLMPPHFISGGRTAICGYGRFLLRPNLGADNISFTSDDSIFVHDSRSISHSDATRVHHHAHVHR